MQEQVYFSRVSDFSGLELYRGIAVTHRVPRHIHRVFSINVGEAGVGIHATRQGKSYITPGSILLVNMDEAHSGSVPEGHTYSSRSIRIGPALLGKLLDEIAGQPQDTLHLLQPIVYNPVLARQILHLHEVLGETAARLEKESLLLDILAKLYACCSRAELKTSASCDERTPVTRVCEYLQDCFYENVSLEQLSAIAGLSAFHLSRVFTKATGVPPHVYQLQIRLTKATDLLASGKAVVEVALATGFCDQSHFQKAFKKKFGLTPGRYER